MMRNLLIPFLLLGFQAAIAQNAVKVVDAKTGESIPYANIRINGTEDLVTNAEGYFTLSESQSNDAAVLTVSYLGYVNRQLTVADVKAHQYTIGLEPGIVELANVDVSNIKPDPYRIMAEVKKNLSRNYKSDGQSSKDMLFFREANSFRPKKLDVEFTKSTGFSKQALKSVNAQLTALSSRLISQPPREFTDMLCNYYKGTKKVSDKAVVSSKLEVVKATRLKDENRSTSLEDMDGMAAKIFLTHLDSTKYYRFKSGLFGSHDTISLRKDFKKKEKKPTNTQLTNSKTNLGSFMSSNNFLQSEKLDFVKHPDLYDYSYEGALYSSANEFVYVLKFWPKKSKAKYTGKLYVSETDYAVLRTDYTLAEGETTGGLNLKLLLGVKFTGNVSRGTIIYKPKPTGDGYYLQYASMESGQYFYVHRPLKFIELTEEEKDVVAFDLKIEGNASDKKEFLNISRSEITDAAFENVKEEEFSYIRLKRYDPKIWKDYSAIEPLEEMKQFQVPD
jgi:hypothetical protein